MCLSPKSSKAHSKHEGKGCPLAQRFKCDRCDAPSCLSHNTLCCLKSDISKRRASDPGNGGSSGGGNNGGGSGGHKPKNQKRRGSQQLGQKKSSDKNPPSGDGQGEKQCRQLEIFGRQVEFPFQRDVQLENYARGNKLPLNWALMPICKLLISYLDKENKPRSASPLTLSDSGNY